MRILAKRQPLSLLMEGSRALEGTVGRRMATSFVVPLPCGTLWTASLLPLEKKMNGTPVVRNMTQAVQWPQHLSLLREAWGMGIRRLPATAEQWQFEDYRDEVRRTGILQPWPLHLVVWIPETAPARWRVLVASRIVSTLGPQLDAGGFFARPMCIDDPFVFLLWPQDCTWSRWSPTEYILPLKTRMQEVLFHMIHEAYQLLWPSSTDHNTTPPPSLCDLIPELKIFRHPL